MVGHFSLGYCNMGMFLLTTVLMTPMLLGAFVVQQQQHITNRHHRHHASGGSSIGDLLGDLPTPSLLIELSLAENSMKSTNTSLDDIFSKPSITTTTTITTSLLLDGAVFVHTKVTDTSVRDEITSQQGSGTSHVIAQVDTSFLPGGAYLGIGLANHHAGGYYWARGMGMGASLPAHGIAVRPCSSSSSSELYWRKRGPGVDATETTEESSNSNDGKRSEWADFLVVGDTVQLVPHEINQVLFNSTTTTTFTTLLGVRRIGRPLGADPIVEKIWIRDENNNGWILQQSNLETT
jgi:hypothetical protein